MSAVVPVNINGNIKKACEVSVVMSAIAAPTEKAREAFERKPYYMTCGGYYEQAKTEK